jgi:hypothetical protein
MKPRQLRTKRRVDAPEMARRLGIGAPELAALERRALSAWTVAELNRYVRALGCALHVLAVAPDFEVTLD